MHKLYIISIYFLLYMKKTGKLIKNKKSKRSRKNLTKRRKGGAIIPNMGIMKRFRSQPVYKNKIKQYLKLHPHSDIPDREGYYAKYLRNALKYGRVSEIMSDPSNDAKITQNIMNEIYGPNDYEIMLNDNCDYIAERIKETQSITDPNTLNIIYEFTMLRCKKKWTDDDVNKIIHYWSYVEQNRINEIANYLLPRIKSDLLALTQEEKKTISNYIYR